MFIFPAGKDILCSVKYYQSDLLLRNTMEMGQQNIY